MARLDIRLSDEDKAQLALLANQEGKTLSEFVRAQILEADGGDRLNDLERRVGRLEEMAGL